MVAVTLLRGDGIGPEIMDATVQLIEAAGAKIEWEEQPAGSSALSGHGNTLPERTVSSIRKNKVALKGPIMTPIGGGFRSVNVSLRQLMDLYANIRPARTMEGVPSRFEGVDLVVVRENTQGLYSGIEHYIDPKQDAAQAISFISRHASDRIIRFAFEYARKHKRKRVTLVHKANILKLTTGLFLRVGQEISKEYPEIEFDDRIVDAMAMQLVLRPTQFDVIVTTNLFGDILSDLTAGLVGGLGLAPSGNYGQELAIFESIHGTAPDIAGQGIANPTALTLSAVLMLRHLNMMEEADRLEAAIRHVVKEGKDTTPDLGGTKKTSEFSAAVKAHMERGIAAAPSGV